MTTSLVTALPRVEDQDLLDGIIASRWPASLLSILEKLQEQHRNRYLPMEHAAPVRWAARTGVPQAQVYSVGHVSPCSTWSRRARYTLHLSGHRLPRGSRALLLVG